MKNVLDFYFSFFIFLKGGLFNELNFEGTGSFISDTAVEALNATVSVKVLSRGLQEVFKNNLAKNFF